MAVPISLDETIHIVVQPLSKPEKRTQISVLYNTFFKFPWRYLCKYLNSLMQHTTGNISHSSISIRGNP